MNNNPYIGSSLDELLEEDNILDEVNAIALKRVYRNIMKESKTYQWIKEEVEEERQKIAMKLLNEGISIDIISRVTDLSVTAIQQLFQANQEQD